MERTYQQFNLPQEARREFILKAVYWSNTFSHAAYFNPNDYKFPLGTFDHFLAVGVVDQIKFLEKDDFKTLKEKIIDQPNYWIGHFTYDLKNQIEKLHSKNEAFIEFQPMSFFLPETLIKFDEEQVVIHSFLDPNIIFETINDFEIPDQTATPRDTFFQTDTNKEYYVNTVNKLREHIVNGDIYEINYCHQYASSEIDIDPVNTYFQLNAIAPAPFSAFYKNENKYLLCTSPERFLKRKDQRLISQPIKGTAPRSSDSYIDEQNKTALRGSEKEMAENMMIVDLVRNDLARSCKPGSINVDEIFEVYSFPLWHQMISTVTGNIKNSENAVNCIKNAFPMGSMTGAPKIKVMELADRYESFQRNIYSGSIGYFKPNGDFDFNVVIRSLTYDHKKKRASFAVGGAITYDSNPEDEYKECLLKAQTFKKLFKIKE